MSPAKARTKKKKPKSLPALITKAGLKKYLKEHKSKIKGKRKELNPNRRINESAA
jgi:hypothetical protein